MPNIKSAIKRVSVSRKKAAANTIQKSTLRTVIKKSKETVAKGEEKAPEVVKQAVKTIDKAVAKNLIHKNTAARKKSKMMKALNAASK